MRGRTGSLLVAAGALAITVTLVLYPDLAFQSAQRGLRIWWFVVFPALLPFFIAGQVLMALGVVHSMGVMLERFMRPLFNVPGVGAFVVAMGLASGYPIGAVLTAKLLRQGQLNTAEAERLMSFCNTADPLFMGGAVAVGMFGQPVLAGAIMACHYLAALGTGLVLRFHRAGERSPDPLWVHPARPVWARAIDALLEARRTDGRPFGQLLAESVMDSIRTLMLVGGLIILFAVVLAVLQRIGVVTLLSAPIAWALKPAGVGLAEARALVSGLFEITIGTQQAAAAAGPLFGRLMLVNVIIAWSGLSVLAQVAAVVQGTGIRLGPYVVARVLQATLAGLLTIWFWDPAWAHQRPALPAWAQVGSVGLVATHLRWWGMLEWSSGLCVLGLAAVAAVALGTAVLPGLRLVLFRIRAH